MTYSFANRYLSRTLGNHGEDVKECYYYLDSLPTHSYMKAMYKYPQNEYPYQWLVEENRRRTVHDLEFELCDTGRDLGKGFKCSLQYSPQVLHIYKNLLF